MWLPAPYTWRLEGNRSFECFNVYSWLHGRFSQSLSCFFPILLVFVWFISIFHYCSKVSFQVFLFLYICVNPAIFTYPCIGYIYVCICNTLVCLLVSQSIQRYLSYLSDIVCFCLFVSLFYHLATNFSNPQIYPNPVLLPIYFLSSIYLSYFLSK